MQHRAGETILCNSLHATRRGGALPLLLLPETAPSRERVLDSAIIREANETFRSLNWLEGVDSDCVLPIDAVLNSPNAGVALRVLQAVKETQPPAGAVRGEAALKKLLGDRDDRDYTCEVLPGSGSGSLAPYQRSAVARPRDVSGSPIFVRRQPPLS